MPLDMKARRARDLAIIEKMRREHHTEELLIGRPHFHRIHEAPAPCPEAETLEQIKARILKRDPRATIEVIPAK